MYIQSQDGNRIINFDNFHELSLDTENYQINAIKYGDERKIVAILGSYTTLEAAEKEYADIQDSLLDENVGIHMLEKA